MKTHLNQLKIWATATMNIAIVVTGIGTLASGQAVAQPRVVVQSGPTTYQTMPPPPPPRREARHPARPGQAWTPGHWEWRGQRYHWVPGHWERVQVRHPHRTRDRDRDGIPNRRDRHPHNPYRR